MESKTEQSGNERLSWHELNTYTTAKLALRQINDAISQKASAAPKTELLRKAGDFIVEAVDAITNKNGDYSELLAKATDIGVDIINEGLIQKFELAVEERAPIVGDYSELLEKAKEAINGGVAVANIKLTPIGDAKPDREILEIANYVGLIGLRLTEEKLDLDEEEFPASFVNFRALDYTVSQFAKAAKTHKGWDRKLKDTEFTEGYELAVERVNKSANQIKENVAKARFAGQIDFVNGSAKAVSSALTYFNVGLAEEKKDAVKNELYERGARLVLSAYDALVSDDALYSAKRLFGDETAAFKSGKGPNEDNMSWELDTIIRKLETYEKLVDEVKELVGNIAKNGLLGDPEDVRPIDDYLYHDVGKISEISQEILGSTITLFENTFIPAARAYAEVDEAKAKKCIETEKRVGEKFWELSVLYNTCAAVVNDGKRVSEPEFETYRSAVKQKLAPSGRARVPSGEGA